MGAIVSALKKIDFVLQWSRDLKNKKKLKLFLYAYYNKNSFLKKNEY